MPNGSRAFYLNRSQPPFFSQAVRDIFEVTGDIEWLSRMYFAAEKEYSFWCENRMTESGLNRYYCDGRDGFGSGAATMIYALKDRLQALHIHDNDKWHDSHQIPFSMSIDFNSAVKALKDINYQGYLTLEGDSYLKKYSVDNIFERIKNLTAADKRLSDMFGVE